MGAPPLPPPEPGTLPQADFSAPAPEPSSEETVPAPAEPAWRPRLQRDRRNGGRPRRIWLLGGASPRERRLGLRLDIEISSIGSVLHGCRLGDRSERIDHLVVAPSGVWVIIADHDHGPISLDPADPDTADRLELARRTAELVRGVLVQIDMDWVDVMPALCFTNARVRTTTLDGVRVMSARRLVKVVAGGGQLLLADARRVAGAIGRELVVDGEPSRRAAAPLSAADVSERV